MEDCVPRGGQKQCKRSMERWGSNRKFHFNVPALNTLPRYSLEMRPMVREARCLTICNTTSVTLVRRPFALRPISADTEKRQLHFYLENALHGSAPRVWSEAVVGRVSGSCHPMAERRIWWIRRGYFHAKRLIKTQHLMERGNPIRSDVFPQQFLGIRTTCWRSGWSEERFLVG